MAKKPSKQRFAICVSSEGCDDLQVMKVYPLLRDARAAKEDFLRIVDESGEDYLYPASRFVVVELPPRVVAKLPAVASAAAGTED